MLMKKEPHRKLPRFSRGTCTACTMCADICPAGALDLKVQNSDTGFRRYPYLDREGACNGCGACEKECPVGSIVMAHV